MKGIQLFFDSNRDTNVKLGIQLYVTDLPTERSIRVNEMEL
jgi:hypothetical protein